MTTDGYAIVPSKYCDKCEKKTIHIREVRCFPCGYIKQDSRIVGNMLINMRHKLKMSRKKLAQIEPAQSHNTISRYEWTNEWIKGKYKRKGVVIVSINSDNFEDYGTKGFLLYYSKLKQLLKAQEEVK